MTTGNRAPGQARADGPAALRQWEELVSALRSFFERRFQDPATVDDLLQDCFVRVLTGADQLRAEGSFSAWVYRIAANLVTDTLRERGRRASGTELDAADPAEASPYDGDEPEDLTRVVAGWLEPLIANLPEQNREILRAFELGGVPQAEIARAQGLSVSAVKSRVRRGRSKIREQLLACCAIEFDRVGKVVGTTRRSRDACGPDC